MYKYGLLLTQQKGDVRTSDKEQIRDMQKNVKKAFSKVREELDDHLESINQNSVEVQSVYEFLIQLEQRMDKMEERLDTIAIHHTRRSYEPVNDLNYREQELFLSIYLADNPLAVSKLSKKLGYTKDAVITYAETLSAKGIPLLRQLVEDEEYISMELQFKDLQAKQQIVAVEQHILETVQTLLN